jgi:hypothetical protein
MSQEPLPPKLKSGFFDLDLGAAKAQQQLYRPPTLMRTTEWGLLTVTALLSALLFPPYFITVLTIAFLNAGGLLWVTHLSEKGHLRLQEFEREFRTGYQLEGQGRFKEAAAFYQQLAPRYQDYPNIADIARRRAEWLKEEHPEAFGKPAKPAKTKPMKTKPATSRLRKRS